MYYLPPPPPHPTPHTEHHHHHRHTHIYYLCLISEKCTICIPGPYKQVPYGKLFIIYLIYLFKRYWSHHATGKQEMNCLAMLQLLHSRATVMAQTQVRPSVVCKSLSPRKRPMDSATFAEKSISTTSPGAFFSFVFVFQNFILIYLFYIFPFP